MFKPQPLATLYAARILGPLLLAAGIACIAQRDRMLGVIGDFMDNDALTLFAGFLSLGLGLTLVTLHDAWRGFTQILISIIGWLAVVRGALLLFAPDIAHIGAGYFLSMPQLLPIAGCITVFLGLWLALVGFITPTEVRESEPFRAAD